MLEIFHHRETRKNIGISRQIVRDKRFRNSAARKTFFSIPNMMDLVKRRVLKYIGKVVREKKETDLHKSFLTDYCDSPRHVGKNHTDFFIEYVRIILPYSPTSAPLKTWIHEIQVKGNMNALIRDRWGSLDHSIFGVHFFYPVAVMFRSSRTYLHSYAIEDTFKK
jgi:hypothetical protein